jgi:hypothetical protein
MRDAFFFSGVAALAGIMIVIAMSNDPRSLNGSPLSVGSGRRDLVVAQGSNLARFRDTRRDTVSVIRVENQLPYARLTSRRSADLVTTAKEVAHLPINTDLEVAFAERNLKITIRARRAPVNGSPTMRAEYYASADDTSDWKSFLVTPEWQDYTFEYTPPKSPASLGLDFLGIWADPDGLGRGVEVSKITFDTR